MSSRSYRASLVLRDCLEKTQQEEGITAAVNEYLRTHEGYPPYDIFKENKHVTKDNLIRVLIDKKNSARGTLGAMTARKVGGLSKAELVQHVFVIAKLKCAVGGGGGKESEASMISEVLEKEDEVRRSSRRRTAKHIYDPSEQ